MHWRYKDKAYNSLYEGMEVIFGGCILKIINDLKIKLILTEEQVKNLIIVIEESNKPEHRETKLDYVLNKLNGVS
jgi:hypothetical protein